MFDKKQKKALEANLDRNHVSTRKQGSRDLSYIEGWHAIAEANRIFGFENWDREAVDIHQVGTTTENQKGNLVVSYIARVRITVRAADSVTVREGCGYGSGFAANEGDAHESAIKEAETDAMKRALMTFGNPFGLALYDKTQSNVDNGPASAAPLSPEGATSEQDGGANPTFTWAANAKKEVEQTSSLDALAKWWKANEDHIKALPDDMKDELVKAKDAKKQLLDNPIAA